MVNYKYIGNSLQKQIKALPTLGITFVVLGVIILASTLMLNLKSNFVLFAGLFFIVAGVAGYIYTLKKG